MVSILSKLKAKKILDFGRESLIKLFFIGLFMPTICFAGQPNSNNIEISKLVMHIILILIIVHIAFFVFIVLLRNQAKKITSKMREREEALLENEILLNKTGEIAKIGGWEINLVENSLKWTGEVYKIHEVPDGYEPTVDKAIGFYDEKSRNVIEKAVSEAIQIGKSFDVELGIITAKGNKKRVRALGEAKKNEKGNPERVYGVFQDITEKQKMQNELANEIYEKEKLRRLMEESERIGKVGGWEFDIDTLKQTWTKETYRIHEVDDSFDPNVEKGIDFYTPKSKPIIEKCVRKAIENGEAFDVELEIITAKGRIKSVHAIGRVDREARRIYGFFQDITERKKAEECLLEKQREVDTLQVIMDSVPGFGFIKDSNLIYRNANRTFCDLLKVPYDQIRGKTDFDIFPADLAEKYITDDKKVMETGKPLFVEEITVDANSNKRFVVATRKLPWYDRDGKICGVYGMGFDISELKQAEADLIKAKEEAEKASHAKSEFLSNMSHEIRTPMNAIIGFTGLLNDLETDKSKKEMLRAIKYSGDTLMDLINNILSLSKIEAGKVEVLEELVDIQQTIEELENIFAKLVKNGVEFKCEIDERIDFAVLSDKLKIKQILINFLNNAIKFTNKGEIILKVEKIGNPENDLERIRFSVKDTGIGIKQENLNKIFEKFTQEDMTVDKKYGGTGLGLAIAKELARLLNGKIEVQSENNKGSTFILELNLKKVLNREKFVKETIEKEIIKNKKKILLVEDNEINQQLIIGMLKNSNVELDIEDDGAKALEKAITKKYDVILMDLQLPGISGIDIIKEVRKKGIKVKIVVVTAYAMDENKESALEAGADDFLAKPIRMEALINKINE